MSVINAIVDWRPRTPFYYGWLVLGTAALGAFAGTSVSQVVLGAIQNLIIEDMQWDRSVIAFGATAGTLASGVLSPFAGRLADRYGPRGPMPVAVLIVGVCLFALAGIRSVWQFYAAYIVARTIANPILLGVVPQTATVAFFQRRRNLALGLTSMARPVTGAIIIQMVTLIARVYSWRVAYRFLGGFALFLTVPLCVILRRRPEDIGLRPDGDRTVSYSGAVRRSSDAAEAHPRVEAQQFEWRAWEAALTSTFRLLLFAEALVTLTHSTVGFQMVPFLKDSGLSQTAAAGAFSLSTLFGALVNPGWGYLSDKYSPRRLAMVAIAATGVTTSLFLLMNSANQGFIVIILWGTASGGLHVLTGMMLAQYFGRASFGSIVGLMGQVTLLSLGLGPIFGALLVRQTGEYDSLFIFALAAYALALPLIYSARAPKLPRRATVKG